ncbi:hypothetical protein HME9304_01829 [Flagellimonas maritima]|uniref:Uncharacterized protein n=1 Tax=Flagellimonas maritima TaxID=1383885 RepID=A0A2Z4LTB0_9FLAO|nr:hypothetical protein [Allomuricauda aurantiaca]AWX44824.1 hypothetical protein HME9304_01829 [Allomuricauda aurantiaca]
MALNNFFKVNLPYGMMKNENSEWTCFNREYKPLSSNDSLIEVDQKDFIYTKYKGLTENVLRKLADTEDSLRIENGKIIKVFFYSDTTNPSNFSNTALYKSYFKKLEILSKLKSK